jgi:phytoene dehydrogenase-like protein
MARDVVVVGSGPNGLAAAIVLAEQGRSVELIEGADTVGGGTRTANLTLPGFAHDVCSAIHPFAAVSPLFARYSLGDHGLEWVQPAAPVAHPLDDGSAVVIERSLDATVSGLGADGARYRRLIQPTVRDWEVLLPHLLGPMLRVPRHPLTLARFGVPALAPVTALASLASLGERGSAVLAGLAAHAFRPLTSPGTAAFAVVLAASAHVAGWPFPAGGSQRIAEAMAGVLTDLGGTIRTDTWVESVDELPQGSDVLFDVTPRQLVAIAGDRFPPRYRARLERFPYGPGSFKLDYALDGPIPWAAEECLRAGTVHVGGTMEEIAAGEAAVADGEVPERPFVIVAQQSLFDKTRAPGGKHTLWAYCHVPNGSTVDMTDRIERQIERFAPGFRDQILARHVRGPTALEAYNPNYVGGDITGGQQHLRGLLARPVWSPDPYSTPADGIYLCSASTPPGAGVHGMCGYHAAQSVLRRARRTGG